MSVKVFCDDNGGSRRRNISHNFSFLFFSYYYFALLCFATHRIYIMDIERGRLKLLAHK